MWDDEVVRPHPPVRRALREVVEKLRAIDTIEVVDWKPLRHAEAWEIIARLYFCDGAAEEIQSIEESGEPFRPLSIHILKDNPYVKRLSIEELWYWTLRREAYRNEYAQAWNDTANTKPTADDFSGGEGSDRPVDVILCPATPGASSPLDTAKYFCYTSQWNLLDYPALVFPVSKVDPQIDLADQVFESMNEQDAYNFKLCMSFLSSSLSFPLIFFVSRFPKTPSPLSFSIGATALKLKFLADRIFFFYIFFSFQMIRKYIKGHQYPCSLWDADMRMKKSLRLSSTLLRRSNFHLLRLDNK